MRRSRSPLPVLTAFVGGVVCAALLLAAPSLFAQSKPTLPAPAPLPALVPIPSVTRPLQLPPVPPEYEWAKVSQETLRLEMVLADGRKKTERTEQACRNAARALEGTLRQTDPATSQVVWADLRRWDALRLGVLDFYSADCVLTVYRKQPKK